MITKESLQIDRENANVAFLKLKQLYKLSNNKIFLIVEGKDDCAYYRCIIIRYIENGEFEIVPANGRSNAISIYESLDWTCYSKSRVLFFIDLDLSELTGEYTPQDHNVYITEGYSIENSLFNEELLIVALNFFYGLNDLDQSEKDHIIQLFKTAKQEHEIVLFHVTCWILFWKKNNYRCNLNNLNTCDFFVINVGTYNLKPEFSEVDALVSYVHKKCGIEYISEDVACFEQDINKHGGMSKLLRGKYLRAFFVKFIISITSSMPSIIATREAPKPITALGYSNALQLLCGYMRTPLSLDTFLKQNLTKI